MGFFKRGIWSKESQPLPNPTSPWSHILHSKLCLKMTNFKSILLEKPLSVGDFEAQSPSNLTKKQFSVTVFVNVALLLNKVSKKKTRDLKRSSRKKKMRTLKRSFWKFLRIFHRNLHLKYPIQERANHEVQTVNWNTGILEAENA